MIGIGEKPLQFKHLTIAFGLILGLLVGGCGIPFGTGTINETAPTGVPIVFQGTFTGSGGQTASGSAIVYDQGGGVYTLRLESISFPEVSNLLVIPVINSQDYTTITLRATTGSQNYTVTLTDTSGAITWNRVRIYYVPGNIDYATAILFAAP